MGGDLLEEGEDAERGRYRRFMEESYDVKAFVLFRC